MKELKHKIVFASKISPIVSEEKDKYLSLAAKSNLSKYFPKNINFEENVGFQGFVGQAFVANKLNLNSDAVQTEEAIKIADMFPFTYCDSEHSRKNIIGVIVSASFCEFGSNKPLTRDEVSKMTSPFCVIVGGIIWRAPNPDFADAVESSNDPSSEFFEKLYISWELSFSDYKLIVINANKTNLEDGKLQAYGGNGYTDEGLKIGRIPTKEICPLGIGITENPAGQVQSLVPVVSSAQSIASVTLSEPLISKLKELPESGMGYQICDITMNDGTILANISIHNCSILSKELDINSIKDIELSKNTQNNENKISQADKVVVKEDIDKFNIKKSNMTKIEKFEQLTDENLKEVSLASLKEIFASSTKDLLDSKIKDISADYVNKLEEKDKAIKASQEAAEKLSVSVKDLEIKITKASEDLTKVLNENAQREQLDAFSARMESIENDFDLDDKQKEIVANKVKTLATDADFTNYLAEIEVLLAAKKKSKPAFLDKKDGDKDKETKTDDKKEAKASVEDKTALDDALKNGEKDKAELANAAAGTETLNERFKKAFGLDGWSVVNKRKNRA